MDIVYHHYRKFFTVLFFVLVFIFKDGQGLDAFFKPNLVLSMDIFMFALCFIHCYVWVQDTFVYNSLYESFKKTQDKRNFIEDNLKEVKGRSLKNLSVVSSLALILNLLAPGEFKSLFAYGMFLTLSFLELIPYYYGNIMNNMLSWIVRRLYYLEVIALVFYSLNFIFGFYNVLDFMKEGSEGFFYYLNIVFPLFLMSFSIMLLKMDYAEIKAVNTLKELEKLDSTYIFPLMSLMVLPGGIIFFSLMGILYAIGRLVLFYIFYRMRQKIYYKFKEKSVLSEL